MTEVGIALVLLAMAALAVLIGVRLDRIENKIDAIIKLQANKNN